jgi:acetyl-CoA C-acetyltransferase
LLFEQSLPILSYTVQRTVNGGKTMILKGKAAIIGIGEVPSGRFPERPCIVSALDAVVMAIKDAGIKAEEIDMVMPTGTVYNAQYNNEMITGRLVEELGLAGKVKINVQAFSGGSSSSTLMKLAAAMVISGAAKCILCVHSEKLATGVSMQGGIDLFSTAGIAKEWEVPFGQHYSSVAALATQRYKYETGTTDEQLAAICVSNRKWAELNPNAMFRKPLTIEEVLTSKMLSTPLRSKQSNMLADGGAAFIVMSAEKAGNYTDKPVYLLGSSSRVTHFVYSQEPDLTRFSYAEAAKDAFREAGLTPQDIDVMEIYDSYPIYQLIGFEETGFCKRGEGGRLFLEGHTWPGGKYPVTTNGGMLSQGHTGGGGGVALLVESARQLMGKAGERQVKDARFAAYTSTGGTYYDAHVTILGTEVPN